MKHVKKYQLRFAYRNFLLPLVMNNNDIHIEIGMSVVVAVARSTQPKHET